MPAALAAGVNYVMSTIPGTLTALGIGPDRVQQMVAAVGEFP
jgi:peptidyl-tRNA hydrolase